MRLTPWRAMQPDDATSSLDKERLEERLAKLVGGPAATEVTPSTPTDVNQAKPVADAAPVPAQVGQAPDGGATALVEVGVVLDAVALPVTSPTPGDQVEISSGDTKRRRRRRFGFLLFFAGLILVFFLVRSIPADWEIGPFRIDVSGNAADPEASLYFADDPHAPFWLLVPTFNLPPRFFAARPNSTARPIVALAPTPSATPSPSGSASASASASPSSSASPSASPSGTASPSASPSAS